MVFHSSTRLSIRAAIILGAAAVACPAESASAQLSLKEAETFALRRNPDLVVARRRADSAVAELGIARELPNPVFQTIPGVPSQYAVSLPIDIGPQRHYRVRSQRVGLSAAGHDTSDTRRQVLFAVRQAYCDAQLSTALLGIAREQRNIVHDLLVADSLRLRSGAIALRDVVKSRVELIRADAIVARSEADVRSKRVALQLVIGIANPDTGLAVSDTVQSTSLWVPSDSVAEQSAMRRPDFLSASDRVDARRSDVGYARSLLVPTPNLGLVDQPSQPFVSGRHYALSVGVGIPVFNWFNSDRSRANSSLQIAEITRARQAVQIHAELVETLDSLKTTRTLVGRYETGALALSDSALAMARYAYASGATSLVDVYDALRTESALRAEYVTALHDYRVSVFALRRAAGVEPQGPEQ
jgi:outer membrane protein, heavy metal efflux system